jgi:hypothetical protein
MRRTIGINLLQSSVTTIAAKDREKSKKMAKKERKSKLPAIRLSPEFRCTSTSKTSEARLSSPELHLFKLA